LIGFVVVTKGFDNLDERKKAGLLLKDNCARTMYVYNKIGGYKKLNEIYAHDDAVKKRVARVLLKCKEAKTWEEFTKEADDWIAESSKNKESKTNQDTEPKKKKGPKKKGLKEEVPKKEEVPEKKERSRSRSRSPRRANNEEKVPKKEEVPEKKEEVPEKKEDEVPDLFLVEWPQLHSFLIIL